MSPPCTQGLLALVRSVRVGSGSGAKIEAVRSALAPYTEHVHVEGRVVESGVSEQPVGFREIIAGARNRARAAFRAGDCDLAVGIEDGLVELPDVEYGALNVGAAVVTDGRHESCGLSSGFGYPPGCLTPALGERQPIGKLFDELWRDSTGEDDTSGSGRSQGNIGRLTLGVLPRKEYGRHAVLCALIRFLHPELYFGAPEGFESDEAGGPVR